MTSDRRRPAATAAAAAALAALALLVGCESTNSAEHVSAASAAPSAQPSSSPGPLSSRDRSWLNKIHQANLAEVESGELAAKKSGNAAIRSIGAMMASDHDAFDKKVVSAATALHLNLPDYPTLTDSEASDRLGIETGSVYDRDFTATMMTSHQQAISETRDEISHGSSPVATGLARQVLPTLRKHLAALQSAAAAP